MAVLTVSGMLVPIQDIFPAFQLAFGGVWNQLESVLHAERVWCASVAGRQPNTIDWSEVRNFHTDVAGPDLLQLVAVLAPRMVRAGDECLVAVRRLASLSLGSWYMSRIRLISASAPLHGRL